MQYGWHVLNFGVKPEDTPITWARFRRIIRYFARYWREAIAALIVIALSAGLGLIPPLLLRTLLDETIPQQNWTQLHWLCVTMLMLPLMTGLLGILETYLDERVSQGMMLDLRLEIFSSLQAQSMDYFTKTRPGDISSRLNNDVNDLGDIFSGTVLAISSNIITLLSTVVVIFALDWRLALIAVSILPFFIPPALWVGKIRQRIVTESQGKRSELHSFVQDTMSINGFLMRRIFGNLPKERSRYGELAKAFGMLQMQRSLIWRWFTLVLSLFSIIGPVAIYWYGGGLAIQQTLTIGTIVAFVAYLNRLYSPVSALANVHVEIMSAFAVFDRLFSVLDTEPAVRDRAGAKMIQGTSGHLRFEDVSFHYREDQPLLKSISFDAKPGELIALVGPSGAGKSTLTYLTSRFYDPAEGSIRLDGIDIRDLMLESLQAQMATVTQEPFLFHTTLKENLLLAKPDATMAEIESACQAAYIHDRIAELPDGYDTVVGERGYRLSGGERQRLALARVILKSPRILILDEATSSLDSQSEALIQKALGTILQGRTTIAIAHRLSTILHADQILVMESGQIVERGKHADLLAQNGLYSRLYQEQFKSEGETIDPELII